MTEKQVKHTLCFFQKPCFNQMLGIQLHVVLLTDIPEVYHNSKNTLPWKWHSKLFGLWDFCRCGIKHRCFWCCALELTWNLKIIPWERTIEMRQIPVLRLSIWEREKGKKNETWRTQNKLKSWGILSWIGSVLRWALSCDHFGLGLIPDKSLRSLKFQQTSMHAAQGECWKHHMSRVSTRPSIFPLFCLVEVRDYLHFNI